MDERKNRQNWLDAGLQALADEGPEGLRIMPIAEKLGVTKGSFYWHFKNLDTYQQALLEEWERSHTLSIIDEVEKDKVDARSKLHSLLSRSASGNFKLARAIRSWSLSNSAVRDTLKRVDKRRIDYVAKLLRELGRSREEAAALGRWVYCAWIGYAVLQGAAITSTEVALFVDTLAPQR